VEEEKRETVIPELLVSFKIPSKAVQKTRYVLSFLPFPELYSERRRNT
jgi:hypothetical protein